MQLSVKPDSHKSSASTSQLSVPATGPVNHLMKRPILPTRNTSSSSTATDTKEQKLSLTKIILKTKPSGPPPPKTGYSTRARGPAPEFKDILDEIDPDIVEERRRMEEKRRTGPLPPPKKRKFDKAFSTEPSAGEKSVKAPRSIKKARKDEDEDDDLAIWENDDVDDDFAPKAKIRVKPSSSVATRTQRGTAKRRSYKELEGSSGEEDFDDESFSSVDESSSDDSSISDEDS